MSQQNSYPWSGIVGVQVPTGSGDYNMTPTAVVYSAPIKLEGQVDASVTVAWSGSDGSPPNGSGSFQVCDISGSGATPLVFGTVASAQEYMPVDTWSDYQLTGALGAVTSFPINGKSGFQNIELKNVPWKLVRFKYTPSGAGSGSLFVRGWVKGRG